MSKKRRKKAVLLPDKEELLKDQMLAENARTLKARIGQMEKKIREFHQKRWPEKSLIQILRVIRGEFGAFGAAVAIAHIKRNRWSDLPPEDKMFVEEEKRSLLENQPRLKEEIEGMDCPCAF